MDFEYLRRLNSATKYPSIPNYHKFGQKGALLEETNVTFDPGEQVTAYEKIDGTNVRIVKYDHPVTRESDLFIGSREHLLFNIEDRCANLEHGIVEMFHSIAQDCDDIHLPGISVFYFEFFGGKLTAGSKAYADDPTKLDFRLIDVVSLPPTLIDKPCPEIAAWREKPHDGWLPVSEQKDIGAELGVDYAPIEFGSNCLWGSTAEIHAELKNRSTKVAIEDSKPGNIEGFIVRNDDRSKICKIKLANYVRHETLQALEAESRKMGRADYCLPNLS